LTHRQREVCGGTPSRNLKARAAAIESIEFIEPMDPITKQTGDNQFHGH